MNTRSNYLLLIFFFGFSLTSCQTNVYQQGEELYVTNCSQCHGVDGKGLNELIPPVAASDYYKLNKNNIIKESNESKVIEQIKLGIQGEPLWKIEYYWQGHQ